MNFRPHQHKLLALFLMVLFCASGAAQAQWLTQTNELKAGWNAVFLHVDASHTNLNALVGGASGNQILEIWRWNPPSVAQFTESPAQPTSAAEWSTWKLSDPNSALQKLNGDSAYLVKVGNNVTTYSWRIKGRPIAPRHDWTISGLNLIGFPTVSATPPAFKKFLGQGTQLDSTTTEVYFYGGGEITNNPVLLQSPLMSFIPVVRGQAYWMRSGVDHNLFNRYFGPFEVVQSGSGGIDFGQAGSSSTFRLRNLTTNNLVVTVKLNASETSPAGQSYAVPPLILRGNALNFTNLTYGYTNLPINSGRTWTLAPRNQPGAEVEVVLGLNRTAITAPTGTPLAGILSFTDSLGLTSLQLPVSAQASSNAGLWVGDATITQVGQYLKSYAKGAVTNYVPIANGNTNYVAPSEVNSAITINPDGFITRSNGSYIVNGINTNLGSVSRPYSLRLIVHNPTVGNAVLLQHVYQGFDSSTNVIVTTGESALHPGYFKSARRITAAHLPWSTNNATWEFDGKFGGAANLTTTVAEAHDDQASNPFLHTYHPDHDNLDVKFKTVLPQGSESYRIERAITLAVLPPANDFSSLVAGSSKLIGEYRETMTIKGLARAGGTNDSRRFEVRGLFTLSRVSEVPTLTTAP
jgi:hypothetical protein